MPVKGLISKEARLAIKVEATEIVEGQQKTVKKSLNQQQFWEMYGVTQSGGSRYESGRAMPLPLAMLMRAHKKGLLTTEQLHTLRKEVLTQVKMAAKIQKASSTRASNAATKTATKAAGKATSGGAGLAAQP